MRVVLLSLLLISESIQQYALKEIEIALRALEILNSIVKRAKESHS